jgi:hypothetical protein
VTILALLNQTICTSAQLAAKLLQAAFGDIGAEHMMPGELVYEQLS